MKQINVIFVYGAGPDTGPLGTGGGLRQMRDEIILAFKDKVYCPRILDWTEYATLVRLMRQYKDDCLLVGHSCGVYAITRAAVELSMEKIPYLMGIAPSYLCPVGGLPPISPNVLRATQVTSWYGDPYNFGGRMLMKVSSINKTTKLDSMYANIIHINAPYYVPAIKRLAFECERALG